TAFLENPVAAVGRISRRVGGPGIVAHENGVFIPIHVVFTAEIREIGFHLLIGAPLQSPVSSKTLTFEIHSSPVGAFGNPSSFAFGDIGSAKERPYKNTVSAG